MMKICDETKSTSSTAIILSYARISSGQQDFASWQYSILHYLKIIL